jgi:hypothetical protein
MKFLRKKIIPLFFSICLALGLTLGGGLSYADPPHWAPAHGYRAKKYNKHYKKYRYIYYPASQVYYSPVRGGYFYPYPGGWTFSVSLPSRFRLSKAVFLELGDPTPYFYHPVVLQQYPVIVVDD